tara:strand:- start:264 stop:467 length:204 start_codon:yes stop_codon:yes gene_type:complete
MKKGSDFHFFKYQALLSKCWSLKIKKLEPSFGGKRTIVSLRGLNFFFKIIDWDGQPDVKFLNKYWLS